MKLTEEKFREYMKKVSLEYFSQDEEKIRDPKVFNTWHAAFFAADNITTEFARLLLSKPDMDSYFEAASPFGLKEDEYAREIKLALEPINDIKVPASGDYASLKEFVSSLPEKEKSEFLLHLQNGMINIIRNSAMKDKAMMDKLVEKVSQLPGGLASYIPDDSVYILDKSAYHEGVDEPLLPDEVNALKGDDVEFNKILDDINKSVLIKGQPKAVNDGSHYAENLGRATNNYEADLEEKFVTSDPLYSKVMVMNKSNMDLNPNFSMKDRNQAAKKSLNEKVTVPYEKKTSMMQIYDYLDKNGFLDNNPTLTAMFRLDGAQRALKTAVLGHDKEKVKECYDAYKTEEEHLDVALSMIEKITNTSVFPSNQSVARVATFPAKYRKNAIAVSNMAGFIQVACLAKKSGVPFASFLNDPMHAMKDVWSRTAGKDSPFNREMYHRPAAKLFEAMESLPPQEAAKLYAEQNSIASMERGMKAFSCLIANDDKDAARIGGMFSILQKSMLNDYTNSFGSRAFEYILNGESQVPEGLLENILVCNSDERDMSRLNPYLPRLNHPDEPFNLDVDTADVLPPFDRDAYFREKKTSAAEIAMRLVGVAEALKAGKYNILRDDVENAYGNVLGMVKNSPDMSKSMKKVVDKLLDEEPSKISPSDLNNISREASVARKLRAVCVENMNPLREAVRVVAELKDEYYSHNFLARHLFPSYRHMKDSITSMKSQFVAKGFKADTVDFAVENYGKEDSFNTCMRAMATTVQKNNPVKVPFDVDEKDEEEIQDELNNAVFIDEKDLEKTNEAEIEP